LRADGEVLVFTVLPFFGTDLFFAAVASSGDRHATTAEKARRLTRFSVPLLPKPHTLRFIKI
jgi:hypothetical protein